jgi:hypothetical protein
MGGGILPVSITNVGDHSCAVAAANENESDGFLRHVQESGEAQKCLKH